MILRKTSALPLSAVLFFLLVPATPVPVSADTWDIGAGYSYESGDFGTGLDTDISVLTLSVAYYGEVWGVSLELPYVSVTGAQSVVPSTTGQSGSGSGFGNGNSSNNISSPGVATESDTRSGMGDIGLSISRAFFPETETGAFHEAIFSIKLPTVSERDNLGSGEADYSLELVTTLERGNWSPLLAFGYQVTGDPVGVDLNDVWFYSLGMRYDMTETSRIGLIYDFRQALIDDEEDSESLSLALNTRPATDLVLTLELTAGLSDSTADSAVQVSISRQF